MKVLLFPTKGHYRDASIAALIDQNLRLLAMNYEALGITSLGLPKLGCGYNTGQLSWEHTVRPIVYNHLMHIPLPVKILTG